MEIPLLMTENWCSFESRMMERCAQNAGIPSRCLQSNLLSVVINAEPPDGTDKMLFHHQSYHLIFDNVCRERLYPTVKTGSLCAWQGQ